MIITKTAVKISSPVEKIEKYDRFLFVGPHPDDIEIGAGAFAAKLVDSGKTVKFLICTDGRFGLPRNVSFEDCPGIIDTRRKEAKASSGLLGVREIEFLDFSDGGFYDISDLRSAIAGVCGSFKPDVIFAPDIETGSECHIDHINVSLAVRTIATSLNNKGIMNQYGTDSIDFKALAFYMTARPNYYVTTGSFFDKQLKSIFDCHLSQFPKGSIEGQAIEKYLKIKSFESGLHCFSSHGECFRVLNTTQMHCLPEYGF